jgi:hypothetical protein
MSKESKPADLARQLNAAAASRPDAYCKGCGYFNVANGHHRADCTAPEGADAQ